MLQAALKAGAEIRLNCGVKQLIVAGGRVTGVVAQDDGRSGASARVSAYSSTPAAFRAISACWMSTFPAPQPIWYELTARRHGRHDQEAIELALPCSNGRAHRHAGRIAARETEGDDGE